MDFSTEQICRVEELAKFLTPISEIAILMEVPLDELRLAIRDRSSAVSRAYYRAKAETALALRKQEIELANVGSPLAVQLTTAYMVSMDSDEDL
jgi:hypothetical protein